jgi:microsomal dipeptidase-like Zn-dependent dipeptidase
VILVLCAVSCGPTVGGLLNRVHPTGAVQVSERAADLHAGATVVDLHADALLWSRDLTRRARSGHVDLPRLREGGVMLQVFSIVTRFPIVASINTTNPWWPDAVTLLAVSSLWPTRTWTSLEARVLRQAEALDRVTRESEGRFIEVRTGADLDRLLMAHAADPRVVGGLVDIEGAHALGDDLGALDRVAAAGIRMIGLAHFYDNAFAGSAHGVAKSGLTDLGRTLVHEMERRGIVVDLAHSSAATIADVLAMATRPLVVSHTGVRGICDNQRNLSDEQLRGVAQLGGVVGIGFWETAACGLAPADVARAIKYTVDLIGDEHVGLGSDFDGAVTTGFDAPGLPMVTQAMLDAGIPDASIPKILGGNAIRLLHAVLPAS